MSTSTATPNIFLVGPMGVGKTTIGKLLARTLGRRFVDSDRVLEERTGVAIALIFELEGEDSFRRREAQIIEELTALSGIVLATGGGAVLNADSRRWLKLRGSVVYLRAPVDLLVERTGRDRSRPLLHDDNPRARLMALMQQRDPLYREVADLIINTGRRTVRQVVLEICRHVNEPRDADA